MNRKYIVVFLITIVLVLLVGCINQTAGNPNQNDPGQKEPVDEVPYDGAALVELRCVNCHSLDRVTREREKELWPDIVERMVKKSPDLLNTEQVELVTEYLQENYSK